MSPEDSSDKSEAIRALEIIANELGIDSKNSRIAIGTKDSGARAETYDGSLKASVFPRTSASSVQVEGINLPGIEIKVLNPASDVPKGAAYEITTYQVVKVKDGREFNQRCGGVVYIDFNGKLFTGERMVNIRELQYE